MTRTVRAVPAILTDDPIALGKMVAVTERFTDFAQIDIMDGEFVPSTSVTVTDIASLRTKLTWEAHLMIVRPERCLEDFRDAGAFRIIFHYEAAPYPDMVIGRIKELGLQAGLAVNPETTIEDIAPYVDALDSVLFMSVNPGYYGAPFLPEVLDKVKAFRKKYPKMELGIDGGANQDTIPQIVEAGVDAVCIGSAIYQQPDPGEAYRWLTRLANTYAE